MTPAILAGETAVRSPPPYWRGQLPCAAALPVGQD